MDENSNDISKDGVRIVTLPSWHEFHEKISDLKSERGFVWRGQKKDENDGWFLLSSFDRKFRNESQKDRDKKLKHHLNNFKQEMSKVYLNVLKQDDNTVWAFGQHYGLCTPLLDWTLSPYIAAYFACIEGVDQNDQNDRYRYVYALNRSVERLLIKKKIGNQVLSSNRSIPFIDQLPYTNPRFSAQKGIFTRALDGNDIWNYIQIYRKISSEVAIVKLKIPTKDREECLGSLQLMGIDQMSLLLDFRNIVETCNNKLKSP